MTLTEEQVYALRTQWAECMADVYNAYGQFELSAVPSLQRFNELIQTTLPVRSAVADFVGQVLHLEPTKGQAGRTTLRPTPELRWLTRQGYQDRLQQKYLEEPSGAAVWRDIPAVATER